MSDVINDELFKTNVGNDELFKQEEQKETANTATAKCPSCGANLVYDIKSASLKCPYCGTTKEIDKSKRSEEMDIETLFAEGETKWSMETRTFRCSNCGAVTIISKEDLAKKCAFCGTDNIVESNELSGVRPNAVLPFAVTKEQAEVALTRWVKKRAFAPSALKKEIMPEKLRGNYLPCFTFDSRTETNYTGRLGEYYYVEKVVDGKIVRERKIRYFSISGHFTHSFDDITVQASDRIPTGAMDKLLPFDTREAQAYSPNFLHGFTATQYNRNGRQCWQNARDIMSSNVKRLILSSYKYDVVDSFNMDLRCYDVTYKYVLVPVYVGHYSFKTKVYNFYVNARSGKVAGQAPKSPLKVGALVVGIIAVIALLIVLYVLLGGNS